jgi:glutamate formiminotransferase / 5-formyltetrahydrofolate cyclo-ligase
VLECVVNVSEGRRPDVLAALTSAAGSALLDVHSDADHNRSVLTLGGPDVEGAVRALAVVTVEQLDLREHSGVHPRLGVLDVVPFVPLARSTLDDAVGARGRFARWAADVLELPCFLYGPERSLPEVRKSAFSALSPDTGPPRPHRTAGATCVGARPVLVAYNLWLGRGADLALARSIASELRSPGVVRALGLQVGDEVQVSLNLVDPTALGPDAAFDAVAARAPVARAELVGLLPRSILSGIPRTRWDELDLSESRTIEAGLRIGGSL